MTEAKSQSHWGVGQRVEWERINPYTIVGLVGKAGNIHISETGRYHVFWHREPAEGRRLLVHHGGPEGFKDLDAVKRQHERVILRYIGIKVDIPLEQQEEGVTPQSNQSFLDLAQAFKQLEIPGEQQLVTQWISTLQNVSRDLPQARIHGELTGIREDLEVLLEGKLGRSINRYKKAGAESLVIGLQSGRGGLLASVSEAQKQLLLRAQESVAITLGTMRRYNDLERLQLYWNEIVGRAPHITARAARIFQSRDVKDLYDQLATRDVVNPEVGLIRKLAELKGEPYLSRAQEIIKSLNRMQELVDRRDYQRVTALLTELTGELEVWKRRVRQQYTGVDFGKYALE